MNRTYPKTQCQGLSMSFCFGDMARGLVNPDLVINVICGTNTALHTGDPNAGLDKLIRAYRETYWSDCGEKAEALVRKFWAEGRIDQPRVRGEEPPNLSRGHWITD